MPVACHVGHFGTRGATHEGGRRRAVREGGVSDEGGGRGGSSPAHILNPEGPRREHACQKLRKMRDYRAGSLSLLRLLLSYGARLLSHARERKVWTEKCARRGQNAEKIYESDSPHRR